MEKCEAAGKVIKMPSCPGHEAVHKRKWGGIYDARMLLSVDMTAGFAMPDTIRPTILKSVEERREGKKTKL